MIVELERQAGAPHVFEVVDRIPAGYHVWCIGRDGLEGYLPICQIVPKSHRVVLETLKVVRMPEPDAQLVARAAIRYGADTVERAEKIAGRQCRSRKLVEAALEILRKYSE